jgi:hypothetical protein
VRRLERETGIEPATNSLEGCDSTTELLPHLLTAAMLSAEYRMLKLMRNVPLFLIQPLLQHSALSIALDRLGGEGRIRTFEAAGATDLQSVAFDRFATSPISTGGRAGANALLFFALVGCIRDSRRVRLQCRPWFSRLCSDFARARVSPSAGNLELAKGFEPPTG